VVKDKPIKPEQVRGYLERAFGDDLAPVQKVFEQLATSFKPDQLAERAFGLYEKFRPAVPRGTRGWGHKGELDLQVVRSLRGKA
jgi:hypothetical protein